MRNEDIHVVSQAQVVAFPFFFRDDEPNFENLTNTQLSESRAIDISAQVRDVEYKKSLGKPAGVFKIGVENDRDWKDVLPVGTWLAVYMSQDGDLKIPREDDNEEVNPQDLLGQRSKLRFLGRVDTVRPSGVTGEERGDIDITYTINGRDFGVVYEESEIWHNRLYYEASLINSAKAHLNSNPIKKVDGLLKAFHDLFLAPSRILRSKPTDFSLQKASLQWLLPNKMLESLGLRTRGESVFYGNVEGLLQFDASEASYPVDNPLSLLNGNLWQRLKAHSLEDFHELYPELGDDGYPHLYFRPIPWRLTSRKELGPLVKTVKLFKEIDRVEIPPTQIINFDVSQDDHARYNLFLLTLQTSLVSVEGSISGIPNKDPRTGFPRYLNNSIKRNGLRLMYSQLDALIQLGGGISGTEKIDPFLLTKYNELLLEYWQKAVFMESGSFDILGNNEIRIGKVMQTTEDSPYHAEKLFYIEGYSDTYQVLDKGVGLWYQKLDVTRGARISQYDNPDTLGSERGEHEIYKNAGDFTRDDK